MSKRILALFSVLALLNVGIWGGERIATGSTRAEAIEPLTEDFRTADGAPAVREESLPSIRLSGQSDALGDSIWGFDCQNPPDDNQCLGVEFDGDYFYITGGGGTNHPEPNKLHFFDRDGNYVGSVDQPTSPGWGWRDIAWDGSHFYSSENSMVTEWFVTGLPDNPVLNLVGSFPGPQDPNRAMAYDPATDHFWTADFYSSIYQFDRSGAVINQYPNTYSIYGMAWDTTCPDGPWLWISAQDPSMVFQFDPATGTYTGVSFPIPGTAGGCAFSEDWHPEYCILFYLAQGYPDRVIAYEMCLKPPPSSGLVTGGGWIPGEPQQPGDKRTFGFNVHCEAGAVWGQLQFKDHGTKMRVHSDTIEILVVQPGDTIAGFSGDCRVDGMSGYSFECEVQDRGEPGHGVDKFSIDIYDADGNHCYSAGDFLGGGNIQVHTPAESDFAGGEFKSEPEPGYHPNPLLRMDEKMQSLAIGQGLSQNYPNPFSHSTSIKLQVKSEKSKVSLSVYDLSGRLVRTLVDEPKEPGCYSVSWDGRDEPGRRVAAGVYFYRLTGGDQRITKKSVLLE